MCPACAAVGVAGLRAGLLQPVQVLPHLCPTGTGTRHYPALENELPRRVHSYGRSLAVGGDIYS
jgi:hypothetical protein